MICAKTAEPIEMPFGIWTWIGPRNHVLEEVQSPTCERAVLRAKRDGHRTCSDVCSGRYSQSDSAEGQHIGMVWMLIGV